MKEKIIVEVKTKKYGIIKKTLLLDDDEIESLELELAGKLIFIQKFKTIDGKSIPSNKIISIVKD